MNVDQLITSIYKLTQDMNRSLLEGNYEDFEKLLINRNELMNRVDFFKAANPDLKYSSEAKRLIEESFRLDQQLNPYLKAEIVRTKNLFIETKMKNQLSTKYKPNLIQTDGVFIDTKK